MELEQVLRRAVELGASDIHLKVERPPVVRRDGNLGELEGEVELTERDLELALEQVCSETPKRLQTFLETGELDSAYAPPGLPRFRVNGFRQRGSISIAFRVIPRKVPNFEELSLPAGVRRLAEEHRGLVLVTGATGSGKTTTLAAIIDHINRHRPVHIVTLEDPIEFVYEDARAVINQREIGADTRDFAQGLRRALRQDPDVILVGEMRDAETISTALSAAETGHLVLGTLHTNDAKQSVDRILDAYAPESQHQVRMQLAKSLLAVVSQRLVRRADGRGRVAVHEVMINTPTVQKLIEDDKTGALGKAIEDSATFYKMQSFNQALLAHITARTIAVEDAVAVSANANDLRVRLQAAGLLAARAEAPTGAPTSGRGR